MAVAGRVALGRFDVRAVVAYDARSLTFVKSVKPVIFTNHAPFRNEDRRGRVDDDHPAVATGLVPIPATQARWARVLITGVIPRGSSCANEFNVANETSTLHLWKAHIHIK